MAPAVIGPLDDQPNAPEDSNPGCQPDAQGMASKGKLFSKSLGKDTE
ncbi:hypothetical protein OAL27_03255 [Verrucomicrobiales bacterium]|jgi:hypothetical protein|nr:hypothetical protein [Verrucomicrobiales bacterium]